MSKKSCKAAESHEVAVLRMARGERPKCGVNSNWFCEWRGVNVPSVE